MEYGLSKDTIARMKAARIPKGTETDYRFCWEVLYTVIGGKKVLLVVHADTRYVMVFFHVRPSVFAHMQEFLHEEISEVLKMHGFSQPQISRYFELAGEERLTLTHGRKALGGISLMMDEVFILMDMEEEGMRQRKIAEAQNDMIRSSVIHPELKFLIPQEFFVQRMRELLA